MLHRTDDPGLTEARATTKLAGQTILVCICGLAWSARTSFAASISLRESCALGSSWKTSSPRPISDPITWPLYQ